MKTHKFYSALALIGIFLLMDFSHVQAQIFRRNRGNDCACEQVIRWGNHSQTARDNSTKACNSADALEEQANTLKKDSDEVIRAAREYKRYADELKRDTRTLTDDARKLREEAKNFRNRANTLKSLLREREAKLEEKIIDFHGQLKTTEIVVSDKKGKSWADNMNEWNADHRTFALDAINQYNDAADEMERLADMKSQQARENEDKIRNTDRRGDDLEKTGRLLATQSESLKNIVAIEKDEATIHCVEAGVTFLKAEQNNPDAKVDLQRVIRFIERNYEVLPVTAQADIQILVDAVKRNVE